MDLYVSKQDKKDRVMQKVWNLMFIFIGPVSFSLQKNVCFNNLLRSRYTYHKKGLVFILWSQRRRHKPRVKKNATKLFYQYARSAKSLRSQWDGCLIKQQMPKEQLTKYFKKKKKKKKTLTLACMFFNLLYDVSILVFFFI